MLFMKFKLLIWLFMTEFATINGYVLHFWLINSVLSSRYRLVTGERRQVIHIGDCITIMSRPFYNTHSFCWLPFLFRVLENHVTFNSVVTGRHSATLRTFLTTKETQIVHMYANSSEFHFSLVFFIYSVAK